MILKDYYSNSYILFNMINSVNLASREVSIFKNPEEVKKGDGINLVGYRIPSRHIGNINSLKTEISSYKVCDNHRTLYHSSGRIYWNTLLELKIKELKKRGIELPENKLINIAWEEISPNSNRYVNNKEINEFWRKNYDKALIGQDIILDFDHEKIYGYAYDDTMKVAKFLDKYKVPYSVMFSGKKGFHLRIDWNNIYKAFKDDTNLFYKDGRYKPKVFEKMYKNFADSLIDILGLKWLDKSCIFRRQPSRLPYSIHASGNVALPLDKCQLENFNIEMTKPEEVLKLNLYSRKYYKSNKGFNRNMPVFNDNFKKIKTIINSVVL